MKRSFIITFLMIFCSVLSYGQQSYFDKFADMDGVTSVYISKSMISLFPQGNANVNGINIGNIADRLDNIQILSADEKDGRKRRLHHPDFLRTAGGAEHEQPRADHCGRPHHGRV